MIEDQMTEGHKKGKDVAVRNQDMKETVTDRRSNVDQIDVTVTFIDRRSNLGSEVTATSFL